MQHYHLLADLSDAAQERSTFIADKRFSHRFMLGPEHPRRQRHQGKQRHGNEEFPPHARPTNAAPAARPGGVRFARRTTPRRTLGNPPASRPLHTTPIDATSVMIPRRSF